MWDGIPSLVSLTTRTLRSVSFFVDISGVYSGSGRIAQWKRFTARGDCLARRSPSSRGDRVESRPTPWRGEETQRWSQNRPCVDHNGPR
jgi:hypothetical protein